MHVGGDDISGDYVGDLHGVNNIEAPDAWHLYEFWSEVSFGGRANTSLRLGVLDLNADFDTPVTSGLFVSSPHGIGTRAQSRKLRRHYVERIEPAETAGDQFLNGGIVRPDVEPFAPECIGEAKLIETHVRAINRVAQRPRVDGERAHVGRRGRGRHALVL